METKIETRGKLILKVDKGDTLANVLRRHIADDILVGTRAPGARLDERSLAKEFGVSRTPVREALQQLASAGLAKSKPHSGTVVQGIEPGRVSSLCEASIFLESLCARLATRITTIELGRLKKIHAACQTCHEVGDVDGYALENRKFHSAIIAATQNQDLVDTIEFCRLRIAPYQRTPFKSSAIREASQVEHKKIIDALESGDSDFAERAIAEHLKAAAIAIDQYLQRS
jgi:DNA-binding GntR family transcriptional regulator